MRLAATRSAIVCVSTAVRLETLVFPADLLALLLDFPAFIFFTPASRGTPHILIRIVLPGTTKVIELRQPIEEYWAGVGGSTSMLEPEFEKLYSEMDSNHVRPLWTAERSILPIHPHSKAVPWLWKWSRLFDFAKRAGALVTIERGGDRRAMGLGNPGLGGLPFGPPTVWAALDV